MTTYAATPANVSGGGPAPSPSSPAVVFAPAVLPRELFAIDTSPLQLYLQRLQVFIDGKFDAVEKDMHATERRLAGQQRTLEEWESLLVQRAHSDSTERMQRLLSSEGSIQSSAAKGMSPSSSSTNYFTNPSSVTSSGNAGIGGGGADGGGGGGGGGGPTNSDGSPSTQSASNVALIKLVEAMGNENVMLTDNLRNALREIGNLKVEQRKTEVRQDHFRDTQAKYYEDVDRLSMLLRPPNSHSPQQNQYHKYNPSPLASKDAKRGKQEDATAASPTRDGVDNQKGNSPRTVEASKRRSPSMSDVDASYDNIPTESNADLQLALQGPLLAELRRVLLRDIGERVSLVRASLMTDMGKDLRSVRDLAEVRVTPQQVLDILAQQRAAEGSHDIGSLWRRLKDFEVQYVRQDDLAIALRYKVDTMLMPTKADNAQLAHLRDEYDERCKLLEDRVTKLEEERNAMQYMMQQALDQFVPNADGSKWVSRSNRRRRRRNGGDDDDDEEDAGGSEDYESEETESGGGGGTTYTKHKLFPGGSNHASHRTQGAAATSYITADSDPRNLLADRQKHLLFNGSKNGRDRADVNAWQPNTNTSGTGAGTGYNSGDGQEIAGDRKAQRRGKRGGTNPNSSGSDATAGQEVGGGGKGSGVPGIAGFGKQMTANQQAYAKHVVNSSSSTSPPPSRSNLEALPPLPYESKSATR